MKKVLCLFLATVMLLAMVTPVMAAENIKVYVNNQLVQFDVQPRTINGRTMVPLRAIFEKLGASVEWDSKTNTVNAIKENTKVSATIGSMYMKVNGKSVKMDVAPCEIGGRTLVPARFVAEAFGCDVKWDEKLQAVFITDIYIYQTIITEETKEYVRGTDGWYKNVECADCYGEAILADECSICDGIGYLANGTKCICFLGHYCETCLNVGTKYKLVREYTKNEKEIIDKVEKGEIPYQAKDGKWLIKLNGQVTEYNRNIILPNSIQDEVKEETKPHIASNGTNAYPFNYNKLKNIILNGDISGKITDTAYFSATYVEPDNGDSDFISLVSTIYDVESKKAIYNIIVFIHEESDPLFLSTFYIGNEEYLVAGEFPKNKKYEIITSNVPSYYSKTATTTIDLGLEFQDEVLKYKTGFTLSDFGIEY